MVIVNGAVMLYLLALAGLGAWALAPRFATRVDRYSWRCTPCERYGADYLTEQEAGAALTAHHRRCPVLAAQR